MAERHKPRVFSPETLYELSISTVLKNYTWMSRFLTDLPSEMLLDIYYQMYKEKNLWLMIFSFSNLEIFSKMLTVTSRHTVLLQIYQALVNSGSTVIGELAESYCLGAREDVDNTEKVINLGLRIGGFFSDGGWYAESEKVLLVCKELCLANNNNWCKTLECYRKLLHVQTAYCLFTQASKTYQLAVDLLAQIKEVDYKYYNCAAIYTEFSIFFHMKSHYDEAYKWIVKALKELKYNVSARVIVDVLRQAAKLCILKCQFQSAGFLIREAVHHAREVFGTNHPIYSNVLTDYGFYWLNSDNITNSVNLYKEALAIKIEIFGSTNLHVALAHEDLAYAFYVYEYRSGEFSEASVHIEKAIAIMLRLLHPDHLLLASAKRINALILEEIALDSILTPLAKRNLLLQAESLHLSALQSAIKAFGRTNVQVAKHYGNLGRVYQSMKKWKQAERMHLKAIIKKRELLGPDDHEVGLSIGHLASLYNYHMRRYKDAEQLYLSSIKISLKLFGKSYSGLEYDYHGLLHVYMKLKEYQKVSEYERILSNWKILRNKHVESEEPPIDLKGHSQPIENVIKTFFSM